MAFSTATGHPLTVLRSAVTEWVARLAYPTDCPICGATIRRGEDAWCAGCDRLLAISPESICPVCRRYQAAESERCPGGCEEVFPRTITSLGAFDRAWRDIIHALKYQGRSALAAPLGRSLAQMLPVDQSIDLVVPVPTDAAKRRTRGFGHAEEIARALAHAIRRPCDDTGLEMTRRVADQTRLTGVERFRNLDGAFTASPSQLIRGRTVLIVDDVMTTGATMREAGRAFKAAGAKVAYGAVLCVNMGYPDED